MDMTGNSPSFPFVLSDVPRAACAHISGIEHVVVTQPQGQKYEWWRCLVCHCEFRPTGQVRPGDGPGEQG